MTVLRSRRCASLRKRSASLLDRESIRKVIFLTRVSNKQMSRILRSYFRFASTMATLESLNFDNTCLKSLPIDEVAENYVRTVAGACFSRVRPTPVRNPRTVAVSRSALDLIDLNDAETDRDDFADYFSGGKLFPGAEPAAHCYCGHQFGNFAGQLGDGAAM